MGARIFLCYAREDETRVRGVYRRLIKAGFEVWMDKFNLLPGQHWPQEIPRAIRSSDFILIFFSRNSVAKQGYIQREFRLALETLEEMPLDAIHIIPIRLDNCQIPEQFHPLQWSDLSKAGEFDRIVQALRRGMEQRQTMTPEPALEPPPDPLPRSEHARVEKEEKFFNTISDMAIRLYCAPAGDIELDESGNITGREFLNHFIKEMGLNPGDYFTATFLLINGTKVADNSEAIQAVKDFWTILFLRTRTEPYNILDKLELNGEFRSFLRGFWEFVGSPPLDFFTADFILEAGRLNGKLKTELIANEVKNFWSDMIDLYDV